MSDELDRHRRAEAMTPERWQQVERVFHAALAREASERAAFLAEACADDDALRLEVDSLLAQEGDTSRFLKAPVAHEMKSLIDRSLVGSQLGRYAITALLGRGGMGEVYRATDTRLGRVVAIKVLTEQTASSPHAQARFEREARAVAALNHPHICTVHDIGHQAGTDFLVMEYLEGQTLSERLRKGALSLDQAVHYAVQIAEALEVAHRHGIVHRDLKPGNVMLTKTGAKLLDFGIAIIRSNQASIDRTAAPTRTDEPLTARGALVGTLNYMAPEQLEGREADNRSDLFAFGGVLYEMLTGSRAFHGETKSRIIAAVLDSEPPPLSACQPLAPLTLERLVATCLAKNPDKRWQNAGDLTRELRWILADAGGTGSARGAERSAIPAAAATVPTGSHHSWRKVGLGGVALALMAAMLGSLFLWSRTGTDRGLTSLPFNSIAVLPFDNRTPDGSAEYVAATIGDQIGVDLGGVRSLQVISGQATRRYQSSTKSLSEIAAELNADGLLQGSALVMASKVRIIVRLTEARSQRQLWGATYEGDIADIFNLSRSVTRAVVTEVRATLKADEHQRVDRRLPPVNPAVLQLVHASQQLPFTASAFQQNRQNLERAIELDPSYVQAHVSLAGLYLFSLNGGVIGPPPDMYAEARKSIATALRLDPDFAPAHSLAGDVALTADWDWRTAEQHYQRAFDLNPSMSCNSQRYYLAVAGRFDEALAQLGRCRQLNPTAPIYYLLLAWHHLALRQYDSVIVELDREARLDVAIRSSPLWLVWRPTAEALRGRAVQATEAADALLSAANGNPRALSSAGFALARAGHFARAR